VKRLVSKFLSLSLRKRIFSGFVAALVGATGITTGVVVVKQKEAEKLLSEQNTKKKTNASKKKEPEKAEESEVKNVQVDVPVFTEVALTTSSIQKDLNIYFNDASGKKVSGVDFKVKLIDPKNYDQISKFNDAILDVDKKIGTAQSLNIADQPYTDDLQKQIDTAAKTADEDNSALKELSDGSHVNKKTGSPLTVSEALLIEKNNDIASYNDALNKAKGNTYEDKDKDGIIYLNKINAGNYKVCFVPVNGYSAQNFSNDANVKEKIEYKPVANVKQKVEKNVQDPQPRTESIAPVEAKLSDTVEYVQTSSKDIVDFNKQVKSQTLKASVSNDDVTLYSSPDKAASEINIPMPEGSLAETVTVDPKDQDVVTAAISDEGRSLNLKAAANVTNDRTAKVTVKFISAPLTTSYYKHYRTAEQETALTKTYNVTVKGSSNKLFAEDKKTEIYTDNSGSKSATIGDYESDRSYNEKTVTKAYYGWQTIDGVRYYFDKNGNKVTGSQVISGCKYNFGSDGALLTSGTGIDVSKWQGNINWSEARSAISFAIIRCGFRGSSTGALAIDPYYAQNMKNAKANGVKVGIYFYSNAKTEAEAVEEASLAIQLANEQGGVSLPIYIDIEGKMGNNSPDTNTAIANAFIKTVNSAGYRGGVYSSYSWFNHHFNLGGITPNASIWCARYNTYCGLQHSYDIWQYSSKGSIPGIKGNVDMDIAYF